MPAPIDRSAAYDVAPAGTPTQDQPRWRLIGPGLVVAATGVGAADLVATLVAGSKYGYALLWCVVVGCVMKVVLVEGAARYSLASGRYGVFEKVLSVMVLLMFVSMVGAAALTVPNLPELPFLAVTLLWLLNTDRVPREWRNRLPVNIAMALCALTFAALAVNELQKAISQL